MRISELARRAGVPIGTVKYYLRERLLPPGELTAATQARYSEAHLARLRLVRALVGIARLSIAETRAVLAAVDDPATSAVDTIGGVHKALPDSAQGDQPDLAPARAHLSRWGWPVDTDAPALGYFARALDALGAAGFDTPDDLLDRYARAAAELAEQDVADMPTASTAETVRFVVIGTLLLEPVLLSLRRLAHEEASRRRFRRGTA